ncbi:MAG: hypothetical protein WD907_07190, partial [Bacilli bacterium]
MLFFRFRKRERLIQLVTTIKKYKHFLSMKDLDTSEIYQLIDRSFYWATHEHHFTDTLKETIVANMFFEPSTRTRFSFEVAEKRLGA